MHTKLLIGVSGSALASLTWPPSTHCLPIASGFHLDKTQEAGGLSLLWSFLGGAPWSGWSVAAFLITFLFAWSNTILLLRDKILMFYSVRCLIESALVVTLLRNMNKADLAPKISATRVVESQFRG